MSGNTQKNTHKHTKIHTNTQSIQIYILKAKTGQKRTKKDKKASPEQARGGGRILDNSNKLYSLARKFFRKCKKDNPKRTQKKIIICSYTVWENFAEQHLTRLAIPLPLCVGDSLGGTPMESP